VSPPRVLFVSHDPVGEEMAGLGIRTFELARVVARHADVTVAHGGRDSGPFGGLETLIPFKPHDPAPLRSLIASADVVVAHPVWPVLSRCLRRSPARVVHDLYNPETLETLELFARRPPLARRLMGHATLDRLHDALRTGHHFMCASERQRDLWLGAMLALRLIEPEAYDADPGLRSVIDTVPFGLPSEPPAPAPGVAGPRDRIPALDGDSELVLWNGGIWDWLDGETAVRAAALLAERRPRLRLVFMGGSPHPASRAATERVRAVAAELGVLDRVVAFHSGWVPYAERSAWLAEADCAISTHRDHLETRFAFRTRILDCLWAGVPVVCTGGDDLADRVSRERLGATTPAGDPAAVAAALDEVLERGRAGYADALARAAADYVWPVAAAPLVRWVSDTDQPTRPGDARGAVRPTPGHRARTAAYLMGGRAVLARRPGASGR
jgi:glycosyltransferase involved in cell wall biosynthesis